MKAPAVIVGCLAVLLALDRAEASATLALFSDEDCMSCNLSIAVGETKSFYLVAISSTYSISGGEFRITGLPAGWVAVSTPAPEAIYANGDPFGDGATLAFSHFRPAECLKFYTLTVTSTSLVSEAVLGLAMRIPPSIPDLRCPVLHTDCAPCGPAFCALTSDLNINSTQDCNVALHSRSWSQLKQLFH
jgi:hypothetical protein